jgi:hypothetical protein
MLRCCAQANAPLPRATGSVDCAQPARRPAPPGAVFSDRLKLEGTRNGSRDSRSDVVVTLESVGWGKSDGLFSRRVIRRSWRPGGHHYTLAPLFGGSSDRDAIDPRHSPLARVRSMCKRRSQRSRATADCRRGDDGASPSMPHPLVTRPARSFGGRCAVTAMVADGHTQSVARHGSPRPRATADRVVAALLSGFR